MPSAPIQAWARLLGDGERAEGFEQWMTQTLEGTFTPEQIAGMTPDERSGAERRLRMGKIIVAAAIEAIRQEGNGGADSVAVALECAACRRALPRPSRSRRGRRSAHRYRPC